MKATLRLFKAVPISTTEKKGNTPEILSKTLSKGFIFSPEVLGNYSDVDALIRLVEQEYGISAEQMNSSFHKSWKKIRDASIEQLVMEQIIHYITTYGFEALGIYNEGSVYVPHEKLDIPEVEDNLHLIVIKGYTYEQLKEKVLALLESGIALKEDTLEDIKALFKAFIREGISISVNESGRVKNKEAKILLYDTFGIVPREPVEFLRYVVFKATDETLLIKNKYLIEKLKLAHSEVYNLFLTYKMEYGLIPLAGIFHRFKPLFLALKKADVHMATIVNKIRKLAIEHHVPMDEDYLNSVTKKIKHELNVDKTILLKELEKVNTFRKIRLASALNFRLRNPRSIMFRIRNGKGYATEFLQDSDFSKLKEMDKALNTVRESIVDDVRKKVEGKNILIPKNMTYALPATEKQFTGNMPTGSYIESDKEMVVGIHWKNVVGKRVDLDLSMINQDGKIGWDGRYRSGEGNVLFSGDLTDAPAPKGAAELFYVKKNAKANFILNVNYFNFSPAEVPYKIIVAEDSPENFERGYMVDPNKVIAVTPSVIKDKQTICGFMDSTGEHNRFYFIEVVLGKSISASNNAFTTNARQYIADFYKKMLTLNDVLREAGAIIYEEMPPEEDMIEIDVDLRPESLEKDTIINLLS